MKRTYLDHIAATPVRPEVFEAMRPFLTEVFGNPQSLHAAGQEALAAVDAAREEVAALIGATASEIYLHRDRQRGQQLRRQGHGRGPAGPRPAHRRLGHRAHLRPQLRQGPGAVGLHVDRGPRRPDGAGRSGRGRKGPDQGDGPRLRHDGQQRGRDDRARGRDRRGLPLPQRPLPHRRRGRRGDRSDRRQGPGRRRPQPGRRPVLRPQGRRGALRAQGRAHPAAHRRRHPGGRPPGRNGERRGHRRARPGRRPGAGRDGLARGRAPPSEGPPPRRAAPPDRARRS